MGVFFYFTRFYPIRAPPIFEFFVDKFGLKKFTFWRKNLMSEYTIETKNSDGTISEIDVSFDVAEYDKKFRGKEKYHKAKTKDYPSFDDLMQQNESFEEGSIAKLPAQLGTPSFESEAISNIKSEIILEAIKTLSEKQRRRIILRFLCDMTISQIAEIEKCDGRNIHSAIKLGLQNLKKILEEINL
jgi:RNA polymerase sigma factor (sigma-70 family)